MELLIQLILVLFGVVAFITGQIIIKFIIDPAIELKRYISKIHSDMVYYADIPFGGDSILMEERMKAKNAFRTHSCELRGIKTTILWYNLIQKIFKLPKSEKITEGSTELIGLSNAIVSDQDDKWKYITLRKKVIYELLGIPETVGLCDKELKHLFKNE